MKTDENDTNAESKKRKKETEDNLGTLGILRGSNIDPTKEKGENVFKIPTVLPF